MHEIRLWEVRIEWRHAPDVTWPLFSYAQRQTQSEAEAEAGRAITFGSPNTDLCAVSTSVRAPGATEWREVARRREASSVARAADSDHAVAEIGRRTST